MSNDTDLMAAVRALEENHPPSLRSHPSPEELFAYRSRELAPLERESVQDHLAFCQECTRMILGLESALSMESPGGVAPISQPVVSTRWDELRGRLRVGWMTRVSEALRHFMGPQRLALGVGTVSLLVIAGLLLWLSSLLGMIRELEGPRANIFIEDLKPHTVAQLRGDRSPTRLTVPVEAEFILLILNLVDVMPFPEYRLEIVDANELPAWTDQGIRRTPDENFTVELPRAFLPAGNYRLRLFGLGEDKERQLVEYALELHYESPDSSTSVF